MTQFETPNAWHENLIRQWIIKSRVYAIIKDNFIKFSEISEL